MTPMGLLTEAHEATARDFELSCPRYTLAAIIEWHLSYEGSKLHNELEELSQDPLILCLEPPDVLLAHVQTAAPSSIT